MRVEIRIVQPDSYSTKRRAFYRFVEPANKYWFRLPVKQAEQAIKTGRVHIGMVPECEAVAYQPATKPEANECQQN